MSRNIGLMGGTFDPPHLGHTVPVEVAAAEFDLERVWFVPNSIPPHKKREDLTGSHHRAAMLVLAIRHFPGFLFSPWELQKGAVSYTVETIVRFRQEVGPDDRLFFIMGSDSFFELDTWYEYAHLIRLCELVIINRGTNQGELKQNLTRLENILQLDLKPTVHFSAGPFLPISSSAIRSAVRNGEDTSAMLNPDVQAYINKHSLYRR